MANFTGPNDFFGEYEGKWDGRDARLTIDDRVGDFSDFLCNITLQDGDSTFRASNVTNSDIAHAIVEVELSGIGSTSGSKDIAILIMHTWDIDQISGYDVWSEQPYGFWFTRVG